MIRNKSNGSGFVVGSVGENRAIGIAGTDHEIVAPLISYEIAGPIIEHRPARLLAPGAVQRIAAVRVAEKNILLIHVRPSAIVVPGGPPRLLGEVHFVGADARFVSERVTRVDQFVGSRRIQHVGKERELSTEPLAFEFSVERPTRGAWKTRRDVVHPKRLRGPTRTRPDAERSDNAESVFIEAALLRRATRFADTAQQVALR